MERSADSLAVARPPASSGREPARRKPHLDAASAPGRSTPAARLRRAGILLASVVFHLVLFLVAFSRAAGDLVSAGDAGGGPQGPVFAVSLVRLQAPMSDAESAAAADFRSLQMKLRSTNDPRALPLPTGEQRSAFAALAERLTSQDRPASAQPRFPADRQQPQGAFAPDETHLSDARSRAERTDSGTEGETTNAASTGALWGAIEPCWRNLGYRGQVAVTLDVSLDAKGALRGPPRVVRGAAALLNEPRLRSEANALAALAACLPRAGAAGPRSSSYRLDFPATP